VKRSAGAVLRTEVRVVEPCPEDWEAMTGDARARRCERCERVVHELSERTAAEIEALRTERAAGERLCVRYRVDGQGQVVTRTSERGRLVGLLAGLGREGA